jgi:hypothetical protein
VGVGNYITSLGLGTPATTYAMVMDMGSSLTWLQCSPCIMSCHRQSGPVFDPKASSTYSSMPCSALQCSELQGHAKPIRLLRLQRLRLPDQLRGPVILRRVPEQGHRLLRLWRVP